MPIEIKPRIVDEDLSILEEMSNAELEVLFRIIVDKGKLTENLSSNKVFKHFYPNHRRYVHLLAKELIAFGSNTFYFNKKYVEIVRDVCEKFEVPFDKTNTLAQLENKLLSKVLERSWENMSAEERLKLVNTIGDKNVSITSTSADVLIGLFQAGGNPAMQLAMSIVGTIAEAVLGERFKTLAAGMGGALLVEGMTSFAASRVVSILTGPIGIALTTAFALKSLGGPAYRVTVPAVIYIAGMRMLRGG